MAEEDPVKFDVGGVSYISLPQLEPLPPCSIALPDASELFQPLKFNLRSLQNDSVFKVIAGSDEEEMKEYIQKHGLHYRNNNGFHWIHAAAALGQLNILKLVAKMGGSINTLTGVKKTVLHIAALTNRPDIASWLVTHGIDLDAADTRGSTALHISALGGFRSIVQLLLEHGASVDVKDAKGRTPLMAAAHQGHSELVTLLLSNGADISMKTVTGKSALFYACIKQQHRVTELLLLQGPDNSELNQIHIWCALKGDIEMMRLLLNCLQGVNCQDKDGRTALMACSQGGHADVLMFLLELGADANLMSHRGETALHFASFHCQCDILKLILDAMADHNGMDENGDTALMYGALVGDEAVVKNLLVGNVDINAKNNNGKTALMMAAELGHTDIVTTLINNNASKQIQTTNGLKAVNLAKLHGHRPIVDLLKDSNEDENEDGWIDIIMAVKRGASDVDVLKMLSSKDMPIEQCDNEGVTLLMIAALYGHIDLLKCLLAEGLQPNIPNANGRTAMAYALAGNHAEIVDILVGRELSIDEVDVQGETMLYHAAGVGNDCTVDYLVRMGADINHRSRGGKTALMVAAEKGHLSVVKYLENAGAELESRCVQGLAAADYAFIADKVEVSTLLKDRLNEQQNTELVSDLGHNLVAASHTGDMGRVQHLLSCGVPINYRDPGNNGTTALCQASIQSHIDIVKLLLEHGANIHCRCFDGRDAFLIVCMTGNVLIVDMFIEHGANVNTRYMNNTTPLMHASESGHMNVVQCLLQRNALTNYRDSRHGASPLTAAMLKRHIDIGKLLLRKHAYADILDFDGFSPLLLASLSGYLPAVEALVEGHAKVNFSDKVGRTPLMAAAQEGHFPVVQYLVHKGALVNTVSHEGGTALDMAIMKQRYDIADWLEKHGAKVGVSRVEKSKRNRIIDMNPRQLDSVLEVNDTPSQQSEAQDQLRDMCENSWGFEDVMSFSIKNGANVNHVHTDGKTALILSVESNSARHVQWLLKYGADVNSQDRLGWSALTHAVCKNNMEIVQLLLQHNADVFVKDVQDKNLLAHASERNHMELVELFDNLLSTESKPFPTNLSTANSLTNAVRTGDIESVRERLRQGSSILSSDIGHQALMSCSTLHGKNGADMVHLLHRHGANPNYVSDDGSSPILESIRFNNRPVAMALLRIGAKITGGANNPVIYSMVQQCPEMTELLLENVREWDTATMVTLIKMIAYNNDTDLLANVLNKQIIQRADEKQLQSLVCDILGHDNISNHIVQPLLTKIDMESLVCRILDDHQQFWKLQKLGPLHGVSQTVKQQIVTLALEHGEYELAGTLLDDVQGNTVVLCLDLETESTSPSMPEKVNLQDKEESVLKADMDKMYCHFTTKVISERPTYIQGFTRDRKTPKIYLYIKEGTIQEAKTFVSDKITKDDPSMSILGFEYIVQPKGAHFLMHRQGARFVMHQQGHSASSSRTGELTATEKVQAGSLIYDKETHKYGTIGCLMYEHSVDPDTVWIVTVGHTLVDPNQRANQYVSQRRCHLVSRLKSLSPGSRSEEVQIGDTHWAAVETVRETQFIDLALVPLHQNIKARDQYSMDIPQLGTIPNVFRGDDRFLNKKRVAKTGVTTGYTTGVIIEPNISYEIQDVERPGLFAVIGDDGPFAASGDSGCLIIEPEGDLVIGLLSAVYEENCRIGGEEYQNVAFCVRLDKCLEYAKKKWQKVLSFNNPTISQPSDTQQPSDGSQPLNIVDRRERFINDARFFANGYLEQMDLVDKLRIDIEMHRQARAQNEAVIAMVERRLENENRENRRKNDQIRELRRQLALQHMSPDISDD